MVFIGGGLLLLLGTAWATVALTGRDSMTEHEFERLVRRSEELAEQPGLRAETTEFDLLVAEAIDELPRDFQRLLDDTPVVVSHHGAENRAYGHYFGDTVARDNYPDRIVLYQDTLERDFGYDRTCCARRSCAPCATSWPTTSAGVSTACASSACSGVASGWLRLATGGELGGDRKLEDVSVLVLGYESIEGVSNALPSFLGLPEDERGGSDRSPEQAVPQLVGRCNAMGEGDRLHHAILQAMLAEEGVELVVHRESEEVGSGGQIFGRCCLGLRHRIEKHTQKASSLWQVPGRQREPPARTQHAYEPGHRLLGASEVQDQEIADDCIKRAILERQVVRVRLSQVESRMQSARERDHRSGDVHADHRRASLHRSTRHVARAAGEIHHPRARPYGGSVQKRLNQIPCDAAEEAVIAVRILLPAFRLEGVERVRINRGRRHDTDRTPAGSPGQGCAPTAALRPTVLARAA